MRVGWLALHKSWNDPIPNPLPNHLWRVVVQISVLSNDVPGRRGYKPWEAWER